VGGGHKGQSAGPIPTRIPPLVGYSPRNSARPGHSGTATVGLLTTWGSTLPNQHMIGYSWGLFHLSRQGGYGGRGHRQGASSYVVSFAQLLLDNGSSCPLGVGSLITLPVVRARRGKHPTHLGGVHIL
jgi:hypothetical protein